ncbi:ABC transporter permease [Herbivorax sp. ANBcel31]|uniref:ABC transporter permease n=1 Tax=Herbivorax sp. ANBcel31 TaxID=3069754 RepID=UPI0027B037CC|nr:ABC transporter permease [Herbivorax sp. ANBcel31]MDQ2085539.1 ABC transporter permease [Herbivorax sp. ANBcel31]
MYPKAKRNTKCSIGVLKALGYRNSSILLHYTKYTLSIGLLGGTLGAILGILISDILTNLYVQFINIPMFKTEVYYVYVIYGIVLSCIFTGVAGLLGSKYVLKIAPADSMRPEGPKAGRKILIESITWLWRSLSFSNKMVVRNTLRNKKRFLFIVFSIALTYGITMTPFQMENSIEKMFSIQYGTYHRMDYNISFNSPMPNSVITELGSLTTAHHIEPKIEVQLQVQTKEDSKAVSIIGIPMNTQMFEFYNRRNQTIDLPKEGILLTEGLSKELNIKEGDFISLRSYTLGTEAYKVEVKGIVKQYLGSNGYMSLEYFEELLSLQGYITGVYVNSSVDPWLTLSE